MNILSLFDGMSCGYIALNRAGIKIDNYYASEVNKYAIKLSTHHNPDMIHLGDVSILDTKSLPQIDLLIGGSPCQSFSFSGKMNGMSTKCNKEILTLEQYLEYKSNGFTFDGQSYLFWEYVRVLNEIKPKYFLLENVQMTDKWKDLISSVLGIEPITINSSLVSAQNRVRLYWSNIPNITQPEDQNIKLIDILDETIDNNPAAIRGRNINKATIVGRRITENGTRSDYDHSVKIVQCLEVRASNRDKSNCLTTVAKDNVLTSLEPGRYVDAYSGKYDFRHYSLKECCRLQTVPDNYFDGIVSQNQAMKMLGNGWNVDTIKWIFKGLKE